MGSPLRALFPFAADVKVPTSTNMHTPSPATDRPFLFPILKLLGRDRGKKPRYIARKYSASPSLSSIPPR